MHFTKKNAGEKRKDFVNNLKEKKLLNIEDMNDLKYLKETTDKEFKNSDMLYGVISSLREKINAPLKNRK